MTVKDNDTLDVTSITVEAWIKPASNWQKGIGTNPGIFHKWNPGGYLLYLEDLFGSASLYLPQADTYVRSITNAWKKGIWYHVASTVSWQESGFPTRCYCPHYRAKPSALIEDVEKVLQQGTG